MATLTAGPRRRSAGGGRCENTCETSQRGQSGAGHEGTQAVPVSGQDSDGLQTGELTAGLDVLVEKGQNQLPQVLQHQEQVHEQGRHRGHQHRHQVPQACSKNSKIRK